MNSYYLDYPFHFDSKGRTAVTNLDDHVKDMIFQILFTSPGERVNRPDFGCGLMQLVFMPNSDVLATATQFLVQGALLRWLSDVITIEWVKIENQEHRMIVDVAYTRLDSGEKHKEQFAAPLGEI
ncbi:MAG: GPW/gp25 family protein [Methanothrix sp.]|nr:GPW/gp25 family protein [Methanothrix sp.]